MKDVTKVMMAVWSAAKRETKIGNMEGSEALKSLYEELNKIEQEEITNELKSRSRR